MPDRFPGRQAVSLALAFAAAVLVAVSGGCSKRPVVPRTPDDVPGYLAAPPSLAGIDTTPLRGRRVLLDPGHGGRFPGAVGPGGLTEAEVNLGVSLYLAGMLQWAGAEVHLTRTADVDFLTAADSSLAADLAARVAICDSLLPDVFVSIHHNSTASGDPHINETQTYYPLGREGADLDLARAIHRRLVLLLEIEPARILPGNFHVLRNVSVPAVLGEPAMISNPVIEGRLTLARSLELEAAAYFLGLRDYFHGGTPRWQTDLPDTLNPAAITEPLVWTFDPGDPAAPGLDPASVHLSLDGRSVGHTLDPAAGVVSLLARELPRHGRLELSARNLAGRATPGKVHHLHFRRDGPWRTDLVLETTAGAPARALVTYHNDGRDLRDGQDLWLGTRSELEAGRGQPLPLFAGHRGWKMLTSSPPEPTRLLIGEGPAGGPLYLHLDTGPQLAELPAGWRWLALAADRALWPDRDVPGRGWRLRHPAVPVGPEAGAVTAWLDPHWPVIPWRPDRALWLEADGCLPLYLDAGGREPWPGAPAPPDTLVWQPLLPALVGQRIVLDPQGGGTVEQGRGPFGARGSDLNLMVARRLATLLRGLGCEVLLLRDDEDLLAEPQKVQRAGAFAASFYLALGRGAPQVRHHPGSRLGAPWAGHTADVLSALLAPFDPALEAVPVVPAYDYVLRHTACPAMVALLEPPATPASEDRLTSPAWQDAEARALLRGLVALLQPDAEPVSLAELLAALGDGSGDRAIGAARLGHATLDGNLPWLPPGPGPDQALISWWTGDPGLPLRGGRHLLELHAGPHWQLWALSRGPDDTWHASLLEENR